MSNMLADAAQILADNMDDFASSTITYQRNGNMSDIPASVGDPQLEVDIQADLGMASQMKVFIITRSKLPVFAEIPQVDDIIIFNGDTYKTYPVNGTYVFENSDPHGIRIRVYATKI